MRRSSVADELRTAQRLHVASLSPDERIRLALLLGRRSLATLCAGSGLSAEEALRLRERRIARRRRPSACLEALLG